MLPDCPASFVWLDPAITHGRENAHCARTSEYGNSGLASMLETTELTAFLTRIDGPTARNGSGAGLSPFYLVKTACYVVKL
jgi:hypothetical protein